MTFSVKFGNFSMGMEEVVRSCGLQKKKWEQGSLYVDSQILFEEKN